MFETYFLFEMHGWVENIWPFDESQFNNFWFTWKVVPISMHVVEAALFCNNACIHIYVEALERAEAKHEALLIAEGTAKEETKIWLK